MNEKEGPRRVCILERDSNGFGFVLCCENDTTDTYVLHVLKDSPASKANLRPGDKIVEVNEINVESECHTDVVKLLQGLKNIRLVVRFCKEASEYFLKPDNGMTVKPLDSSPETLRPKLIKIRRGATGYDFVVKTVGKSARVTTGRYRQNMKGVTGHFVDSAIAGGRAYLASLRAGERIVEINNINVEKESHAYVIAALKSSPNNKIELLVVDKDTDEFFNRHCVSPSARYLHGDLNFGEIIDKSNYDISDSDFTPPVSPYSSSLVSTTSTPTSERSARFHTDITTADAFTRKTEDLIQELRIHNQEINQLKSSLSYSKSHLNPSLRDKYLNLLTRDASSTPSSPRFMRHGNRSTTSSSDDDHSLMLNNNHKAFQYSSVQHLDNLSDVGFNVDLDTLKEHARRQVRKNKHVHTEKGGFENYWAAHRAVNNI